MLFNSAIFITSKMHPPVIYSTLVIFFAVQFKYKEDYEKSRGKSLMEFVDTQSYKVSKDAQKLQSEVQYSSSTTRYNYVTKKNQNTTPDRIMSSE